MAVLCSYWMRTCFYFSVNCNKINGFYHLMRLLHVFIFILVHACTIAQSERVDVLVIGGGTSGVAAGIQSARMGVKTLVVEETPWLGGMISSAGVSAFDGNHLIPSGLWRSFRNELHTHYGGPEHVSTGWVSNTLFEPHVADSILKKMASAEEKLNIIYHGRFDDVLKKGSQVVGAVFINLKTHKRFEVHAKVVIDATELGDALASAGLPFDVGLESNTITNENVGIDTSLDIVQDLTYVAILKDYGNASDCTIVRPANYDPAEFDASCSDYYHDKTRVAPTVDAKTMLNYGRLPNNKYMINWPRYGNDHYANIINMDHEQRSKALEDAKQQTLRFVYFIQHELGYKHLGLADDEFQTTDRLPLIPYHRESRRVKGLVRYTMRYLADPFEYGSPLYRTGIAVGDYPVDHHHKKNPAAPQHLDFYPIPSFNIPLGTLIPTVGEGLIVAEKSISVSNVINGATRLQPVVMLIGQAAGALAAISVKQDKRIRDVPVRVVQDNLLKADAMIMPYIDATPDSLHFQSIQRIAATGILRGKGIPYKWANQTWFYPSNYVNAKELMSDSDGMLDSIDFQHEHLTIADAISLIKKTLSSKKVRPWLDEELHNEELFNKKFHDIWDREGLTNFDESRNITRLEFAVMLDKTIDPFHHHEVDHGGILKKE